MRFTAKIITSSKIKITTIISGGLFTGHATPIPSVIRNVTNLPKDTKENKELFLSQDQGIQAPSKVFFEVAADGQPLGRIEMDLYDDVVPRTAKNFKLLAKGMIWDDYNECHFICLKKYEVHV